MKRTSIQRLVDEIQQALKKLRGANLPLVPNDKIEEIALIINESMGQPNRRFHTIEHIFDVRANSTDPIIQLAALFHDVVYYHVDGGLSPLLDPCLSGYIDVQAEYVFLQKKINVHDIVVQWPLEIFGFEEGQSLVSNGGLNEFLSSVAAVQYLSKWISEVDMISVVAAIEASQPFRKPDPDGNSCFELLEGRVVEFFRKRGVVVPPDRMKRILSTSVQFANLDVANFAEKETVKFLDNTWKLLPENNPILRRAGQYTMTKYRSALVKMEGFFLHMNPNVIFHQFQGVPDEEVYKAMVGRATRNLQLGKHYIAGRLLSASILEALATVSGGDCPVLMFMGGISRGNYMSKESFDRLVSDLAVVNHPDIEPELLKLFDYEVEIGAVHDFRKSPVALFLYRSLGTQKMVTAVQVAHEMFREKITAEQFLLHFDSEVIGPIAEICGDMISTRKERLQKFMQKFASKKSRPAA